MKQFSCHSTPRGHQFEEATSASRPISAIARIRGGHTDPLVSREARPSSSAPRDSSQAFQAPTVPSSEGDMPSSPPQRWYLTRRPPTSPPPESSVCRIPPKRAKTSSPGETSRHAHPDSQALTDSQRPSGLLQKPSSRGLWPLRHLLRAIQIEPSHFILSFISTLRLCDSSQSFGIHLDCSRGTISSTLWLPRSFSTPKWRWTSINPWLLRAPRVPPPFISALTGAKVS